MLRRSSRYRKPEDSHSYFGTFGISTWPATTAAGSTILPVHKHVAVRAVQQDVVVHSRSRALSVSLLFVSDSVHITTIHLDTALPFAAKRRLLNDTATWQETREGTTFLLGDWNLIASDEARMAGDGSEARSTDAMRSCFDDRFPAHIELMQRDFTYRRLGKEPGAPSACSRLDRIYVAVHPTALQDVTTTVTVRGAIERKHVPSDHRAVSADMSMRAPGRRCLQPHNVSTQHFAEAMADELGQIPITNDAADGYDRIIDAARAAHARVRLAPGTRTSPTPHQVTELSLRFFRLCREGRAGAVKRLAKDFAAIREAVDGSTLDLRTLGRILQESSDQGAVADLADIERSKMPEVMETAKRQKVRGRTEAYRPKSTRVVLDGVYSRDGEPIDGDDAVSAAIVGEWAQVFEKWEVEDKAVQYFASFITPGSGRSSWSWPRCRIREFAQRAAKSALGPDGVRCTRAKRGRSSTPRPLQREAQPPMQTCDSTMGEVRSYAYRIKFMQVVDDTRLDLGAIFQKFGQIWQVSQSILELRSPVSEEEVVEAIDAIIHPCSRVYYRNGVFTIRPLPGVLRPALQHLERDDGHGARAAGAEELASRSSTRHSSARPRSTPEEEGSRFALAARSRVGAQRQIAALLRSVANLIATPRASRAPLKILDMAGQEI